MKLWQKGRSLNKQVEQFTVGDDYILDRRLVQYDCLASIAHSRMLGKIGLLKSGEVSKLVKTLRHIIALDKKGKFRILKEEEDCHTAIENYLTAKLGDLGKKIHTGRSRNDQVLTALRLYYKDSLQRIRTLIDDFNGSLGKLLGNYGDIRLPGFTHTRKAMPSSISLWGKAFGDAMKDNQALLEVSYSLVDQSPHGSGAGYGVPLEIDRAYTAQLLGFAKVQENPIYVQHSRGKLETTILHCLSQIMFDLNRLAADLIIFSMPEFGFFELPEEFCTGSSIMPHKKNPDVLELLRARYHAVVSDEFQIKALTANLISGYHRDIQLTKFPTMRSLETTEESLSIAVLVLAHLKINRDHCQKALTEEVFATEKVYDLVKEGMPFREAYRTISEKYR